jgi:uncharacterized protein (TIGR00725 family)
VGQRPYVAVVGPGDATSHESRNAETVGRGLAERGAVVITGGLGGVMAAAARGVAQAGGTTVGILPGSDRTEGDESLTIALPTGLGELRNGLVVRAADVVIAIGGAYGTLSEIALALRTSVPVIGLRSWEIDGVEQVDSPEDAVDRALAVAASVAGPDRTGA